MPAPTPAPPPYASATLPGILSTGAQTLGGLKRLVDGFIVGSAGSTAYLGWLNSPNASDGFKVTVPAGTASNAQYVMSAGTEVSGQGAVLQLNSASNTIEPNYLQLVNRTNGPLQLWTNNTHRATILASGVFLIGRDTDDSSGAQLQVSGGIHASGGITGSGLAGSNSGDLTLGATTSGLSLSSQVLSLALATVSTPGAMSAADKTNLEALVSGGGGTILLAAVGSSPSANGATASGMTLTLQPSDATHPGVLTAADWTTFNGKQASGNYLTALTGDVTAAGPGSAAATVASVGGSTASLVHAAELLANAATDANTAAAIVRRDGSGNVSLGALTLGTALTLGNGGTGQTTAAAALTAILPSQTGANGKVLQSNGTAASWQTPASGGITALTGDVTASGSGSVAATVALVGGSAAADVHAAELLANAAVATATASTILKRDASANARLNNLIEGFATTVSAAGTTTLTVASAYQQQVTGSTTQTFVLPDATTLVVGHPFQLINRSSGTVTVNANGGGLVLAVPGGNTATFTCTAIGSSAGTWDAALPPIIGSGSTGRIPIYTAAGVLGSDSLLNWDSTNHRLSLGTAGSPTYQLWINCAGNNDGVKVTVPAGLTANAQYVLSCGNEPASGQGAVLQLNSASNTTDANALQLVNRCNGPLMFIVNNADVGRFLAAGQLLLGYTTSQTSGSTSRLQVNGTQYISSRLIIGSATDDTANALQVTGTAAFSTTISTANGNCGFGGPTIASSSGTSPTNFINLGANFNGRLVLSTNVYADSGSPTVTLKTGNTHGSLSGSVITIPGANETGTNDILFYTATSGAVTAGSTYGGSLRLAIKAAGNVLVGSLTDIASTIAQVQGTPTTQATNGRAQFAIVDNNTAFGSTPKAGMSFWGRTTSVPAYDVFASCHVAKANTTSADAGGDWIFYTRPTGAASGTSLTEAMRLTSGQAMSVAQNLTLTNGELVITNSGNGIKDSNGLRTIAMGSSLVFQGTSSDSLLALNVKIGSGITLTKGGASLLSFYNGTTAALPVGYVGFNGALSTALPSSLIRKLGTYQTLSTADTAFTALNLPAPTIVGTPAADATSATSMMSVKYTSGAVSGNVAGITGPYTTTRFAYQPRHVFVFRTDSSISNTRIFVGLADADISGVATLAGLNGNRVACLRYDTGLSDTTWKFVTSDGTTASTVDTGHTVAASKTYAVQIEASNTSGFVATIFDLTTPANNVVNPSSKTTNLPSGATEVGVQASITTLTTSAANLWLARMQLDQN